MRFPFVAAVAVCSLVQIAWAADTEVPQVRVTDFQKGVATATDVEAKLGQPQKTGKKDNGDTTLTYYFKKSSSNAARYIPFVRFAAGASNVHITKYVFEFDASSHLVSGII